MPVITVGTGTDVAPPGYTDASRVTLAVQHDDPFNLLPVADTCRTATPAATPVDTRVARAEVRITGTTVIFTSGDLLGLLEMGPPSAF